MSKKQTENKPRPVVTLRDGSVKAAIWRNESENGPFHGVTFARTYKDGDGNYHDTDSYSGTELLQLSRLAGKAYDRANKLTREARVTGQEEEGAEE
jgi:hypothetical protein